MKTINGFIVIFFTLFLSSCSLFEDDYEVMWERDLKNHEFTILNEYAWKDQSMLTTTVKFYDDKSLLISEKMWRVSNGRVEWVTSGGNIVKQYYKGKIVEIGSAYPYETLKINIRRLNMDGSEVMTGYKDYLIRKGTYHGKDCIVFAPCGWQDLGGGGELVEIDNATKSYFKQID